MTPKSIRVQKILLVLSLTLNVTIIAALAGLLMLGPGKSAPQRFDLTAGPMTRAMDEDRRDALRDALRESGTFRPANRSEIRADAITLLRTLRSDEFDRAAFRAAIDRQRARLNEGQAAVLDALTAQIAQMTLEERKAFADRLEEQMRRQPPERAPRNSN